MKNSRRRLSCYSSIVVLHERGSGLCFNRLNKDPAYFRATAVLPSEPFHPVSGIVEPITASKLLPVPVGVTTLGTNQGQEVEFVQVHLQGSEKTLSKHTSLCQIYTNRFI